MRVISFCLWGDNKRYTIGALRNAELALRYYPDFICRFYIHIPTVPLKIINKLSSYSNVEIVKRKGVINSARFMAWRFEPHDEPKIELFISRDTDSRISPREAVAVREWLDSGKTLHIMRDSPFHTVAILGGMFGLRKIKSLNMKKSSKVFFNTYIDKNDQDFLAAVVYPLALHDAIIHDEIIRLEKEYCSQFPTKWNKDFQFIGEWVEKDEIPNSYHRKVLQDYVLSHFPDRVEKN